jgi:hypothetical protein
MDGLWTNRNVLADFVQNGVNEFQAVVTDVFIAVAFFTEEKIVQDMLERGCHVRLIVRLGFPTRPAAIKSLMKNKNIEIRYFSDHSFHPKLYIFGDRVALLGSANLTKSALSTNQEVVISVEPEDPRFDELALLFGEYWNEAKVLTDDDLNAYVEAYERYRKSVNDVRRIDKEFQDRVGKTIFPNINRGKTKKSKENVFLENYRKTYQESVAAFEKVKAVYQSTGKRKVDGSIPLRTEIDSFFSYIRDKHATQEKWKETSIGWGNDKQEIMLGHINEWFEIEWPHFETTICKVNYPLIINIFASEDAIEKATYEEITSALVVLHSFHDRLRFFRGGLKTLVESFKSRNSLDKVKDSFKYLIYDGGDTVKRMANLIYDRTYKLDEFGQANVQELVGWVNNEELPVVNGRTTKVLRFYGFDVRQL